MQTRRYPRTIQEAFGPYAVFEVDRRTWWDKLAPLTGAVVVVGYGIALAWLLG